MRRQLPFDIDERGFREAITGQRHVFGNGNFNKVYSVQFSSLVMALEAASHKAGLASNSYELRRTLESFSKRERMTSCLLVIRDVPRSRQRSHIGQVTQKCHDYVPQNSRV